jgi:hypothetical protein
LPAQRGIPTVRRRRTVAELTARAVLVAAGPTGAAATASQVLDYLAGTRIVTTSHDPATGNIVVELAHDTLIGHWNALGTWLEEDRDRRRWLHRTEARTGHLPPRFRPVVPEGRGAWF